MLPNILAAATAGKYMFGNERNMYKSSDPPVTVPLSRSTPAHCTIQDSTATSRSQVSPEALVDPHPVLSGIQGGLGAGGT